MRRPGRRAPSALHAAPVTLIGLVVAAAGSLGIAVDWIATGEFFGFGPQTEDFAGFGMLLALAGGGLAVYGSGRIGPEQQQSCCGCSCAVASRRLCLLLSRLGCRSFESSIGLGGSP